MKKTTITVLGLLACFTLAGCGGSSSNGANQTVQATNVPGQVQETTSSGLGTVVQRPHSRP